MTANRPNILLFSDYTSPLYLQRSLGISKIASELRSNGFEVLAINHLHIFTVTELEDILEKTVNSQTLFVGFNSMFYQSIETQTLINDGNSWNQNGVRFGPKEFGAFLPHGKKYNNQIKNLIKRLNPNCQIVLGGPDAEDLSYISDYDYVIKGYADKSVVNLANHLLHQVPLNKSRKSIFGPVIIDDYLAQGYDFVNTQTVFTDDDFVLPGETLPIEIARGCIFKCSFCSYPLNGKKKNDYIKLKEVLLAEFLDNYKKFKTTRYIFTDDTFNDSLEKIQMIHDISQQLPFDLEYWAYVRLDLLAAHPDQIDLLFDSGCRACYFGIETLDKTAASAVGKGGSREKLIDTLKLIKHRYGNLVTLHGSFIFGLPHESLDSMKKTADQLINNETSLDSWQPHVLKIRNSGNTFSSDIDNNYEKYGYTLTKFEHGAWEWENSYTSSSQCRELADQTVQKGVNSQTSKITGLDAFYIAGLGSNLQESLNQPVLTFNWHQVSLKKKLRSKEYKKSLQNQIKKIGT
jgi:hypothetical protein